MKKILSLWTIFFSVLIFAQTEKIIFTKKFTYNTPQRSLFVSETNLYFSKQGMLLNIAGNKILVKSGIVTSIDVDLDNNATFLPIPSVFITQIDSMFTYKFEKLNKKDKFSGYSCTYYKLSKKNLYNGEENDNLKMCVAEDTANDVLSFINNNKKDIVKGFPVIVMENEDTLMILKSIKPCSNPISIDFNGELAKLKEMQEKFKLNPAVVDSTVAASKSIISVPTYQSQYKKTEEGQSQLAITDLKQESDYWKGIPQYCTELDKKIPEFKNKKLKEHVKNYAGQLCDMYLLDNQGYGVDVRGTIDQIRYEENYFRNTKFDKNDQKLLDEFLNSLD